MIAAGDMPGCERVLAGLERAVAAGRARASAANTHGCSIAPASASRAAMARDAAAARQVDHGRRCVSGPGAAR